MQMRRHLSPDRRREYRTAWFFILPAVILIGIFGLFPVFYAFWVSLNRWRITRRGFVGLANYEQIFGSFGNLALVIGATALIVIGIVLRRSQPRTKARSPARRILSWCASIVGIGALIVVLPRVWHSGDDDMMKALQVTIWYAAGTVPVQIFGGLLLAVLLDQRIAGRQFFRVVFLLPYIVPTVAAAAAFQALFSLRPESFANQLLAVFGAEPLGWLKEATGIFRLLFGWGQPLVDPGGAVVAAYWNTWAEGPSLALVAIMFFNYWVFIGYYGLIYANGLAQIDRQLFEAAEIDGADAVTIFRRVIVPLLSPTTFFLTILGIIGTFKSFNHIYVLRDAATRGGTDPMSVYIFFTFIRRQRLDQATTAAVVLFLIVLGITLYQRQRESRMVHYGD